jgi:hypothetical protein
MKSWIITALLFFTATNGFAQAQEVRDHKQAAVENYVWNFTHGNIGVMESSFETLLQFRDIYPQGDYTPVIRRLNRLSRTGPTESIRTKAMLVAAILEHPDMKVADLYLTLHR